MIAVKDWFCVSFSPPEEQETQPAPTHNCVSRDTNLLNVVPSSLLLKISRGTDEVRTAE